jgi:hypothetical protein
VQHVKFRRKSTQEAQDAQLALDADAADAAPVSGPYDADDDLVEDGVDRVDLGSLLVPPSEGRELRLQVDEATGQVQAVMLTGSDGMLEMRAFAAPRNGDLWSDVRSQISADMTRQGGTVTEREGRFGTELVCSMPVTSPDGRTGTQPSRVIGVNGPRWFLRATLVGQPALDVGEDGVGEGSGSWEDAIAEVAVRRGKEAMPVGEPLAVVVPSGARRLP